jgi:hypothetical protein
MSERMSTPEWVSVTEAAAEAGTDVIEPIAPDIARKLAALDALRTTNNRTGLPELDLSGARADVYGYIEREDIQL